MHFVALHVVALHVVALVRISSFLAFRHTVFGSCFSTGNWFFFFFLIGFFPRNFRIHYVIHIHLLVAHYHTHGFHVAVHFHHVIHHFHAFEILEFSQRRSRHF